MIRAAVLGGDVSRSRSPAIHRAAFAALGVEGRYEAINVDARGFRALARRLAAEGYRYVNVTIPHKRAAAALATVSAPVVRLTRAANTLVFRGGGRAIRGENTDGYGLLTALDDLGAPVQPDQVHVLVGSGGAAAGGLAALLASGARVRIVARRPTAAGALRRLFPERRRARIEVYPWTAEGLSAALDGAEVLVSAVPSRAWTPDEARAGLAALARGATVLEMAYGGPSPLALAARRRGARYQDGLPMLVHQAARAVELAVGTLPPPGPLLRAARAQDR